MWVLCAQPEKKKETEKDAAQEKETIVESADVKKIQRWFVSDFDQQQRREREMERCR